MEKDVALQEDFATDDALTVFNEGSSGAVRFQNVIAFQVVVLPTLALLLSIYLISTYGISTFGISIFVIMYVLGMLGITLGYHRYFAHRSFETSRFMRLFLVVLGAMSAQGPLFWWVATHRRHHAFSDTPGDPHSPQLHDGSINSRIKCFFHSHIGWMFSREMTNWARFVPDLVKDKTLMKMHRQYPLWLLFGLLVPTLAGWSITGTFYGALEGLLYGGFVRIFFVNNALWCVGSLSHIFGRRPLRAKTKDSSANNYWVALAAFGEGNQNNHHAFPRSARHGLEWWQPDFTYKVITLLKWCRVLWNVAVPPREKVLSLYQKTHDMQV